MAAQSSSQQDANINRVRNYQFLPSPQDLLRQMFEDESGDWEMIATDGKSFKVHQTILKQVPDFQTLFSNPTTVECSKKQVVVPQEVNMCGTSLEAFLRYLYYKDTLGMQKSFSVTCALIRAGHQYKILNLVEDAVTLLRSSRYVGDRPQAESEVLKWFNVPELWELYQQVWQWEEAHPSKSKLMKTIADVLKVFVLHNKEQRDMLISIASTNPIFNNLFSALVEPVGRHAFPNVARNRTSRQYDFLGNLDNYSNASTRFDRIMLGLGSFQQFLQSRPNSEPLPYNLELNPFLRDSQE